MVLKLDSKQVTTAFATFVGVIYSVKSAWLALAPQSLLNLVQMIEPNLNLNSVINTTLTGGTFIAGLIGHVIVAWILAYVFVWFWNNEGKMWGGKARRRRRSR